MTTWRYVITRERHDDEEAFTVRELYAHDDGSLSWTAEPVAAHGETWAECADSLAKMTRAMNAPVLDLTLDPPALVSLREFHGKRTPGNTGL